MGSVADCFDNALAETFFATLKTELIYARAWLLRHDFEMEVFSLHTPSENDGAVPSCRSRGPLCRVGCP
jgi:hypothetical protein